jgi:hypothetical protein
VFVSLLLAAACGEDVNEELPVPNTGTAWVIFGTAQSGRAVVPTSVAVRRATDVLSIRPDPIGGGDVDMFFAGIDENDLPDDIDPASLVFVSESADRAHRLPPFYEPHVLERPRPSDSPSPLVPVEISNNTISEERTARLEILLRGLAVRDPCIEATTEVSVIAPRTQGEDIRSIRTLSNGDTWVGFTATGTAIAGVIAAGATDLTDVVGIGTGTAAVQRDEKVRMRDLGDREVRDRDGRLMPSPITINFLGAFGGVGHLVGYDEPRARFLESSPIPTDVAAGLLSGARHLDLGGTTRLCAFGSVLGPGAIAGIFCRTETSSTGWSSAIFREAIAIQAIAGGVAFDVAGAAYVYQGERWEPVFRPAVNDGCSPPCAAFDTVVEPAQGTNSDILAVMVGSKATIYVVRRDGSRLDAEPITALTGALFADERRDGDHALSITAVTIAPDGRIWFAGSESVIFRTAVNEDRVDRICLPSDARDTVLTALEAHPDGRLIYGFSPPLFGFGDWRDE